MHIGDRSRPSASVIVLSLIPVLLFYAGLSWTQTWLPYEDDYHALLGFAVQWNQLQNLGQRLALIFSFQHNDYKMPLPYTVLGSELALTHHVSIVTWIVVGNLLPLVVLAILWCVCAPGSSLKARCYWFLPVIWIIMNLNNAETLNFALSGIQEFGVLVLSLAALWLLLHDGVVPNLAGCVVALLACFTYANAFPLALVGVPLLWWRGKRTLFCVWLFCFATAVGAYLYRYTFVPHPRPSLMKACGFFVALVGCSFDFGHEKILSLFAGLLLLSVFAYMVRARVDRIQPFAFWATVWLLTSFVLVAYGRAYGGVGAALPSRYKVYGDLLLALLYLQGLEWWRTREVSPVASTATRYAFAALVLLVLCGDAYGFHILRVRETNLTQTMPEYVRSHGAISPMAYNTLLLQPSQDEARDALTEALKQGIYTLPANR
jgi:hypothetical protein